MTAQTLAAECEVSVRTIYRDVDALSEAGIPIYAERGGLGGYQLLEGYRTRLNGLSAAEAESLFLAGIPAEAAKLGLSSVASSARIKLLAALPAGMRSEAEKMGSRFHLDAPAWFVDGETLPFLPVIVDAIRSDRALRLRYRSWRTEVDRRIEPLGLVLKGGFWYLVAQVETNTRTYRVSRIQELTQTDEVFERPAKFDLAAYWTESIRQLEADLHPVNATLRMTPWAVKMMEAFLPPYVQKAAEIRAVEADGWHIVRLPVGKPDHSAYDLLRFGPEIEVLEPAELRDSLSGLSRAIAARYGVADTAAVP